MSVSLTVNLSTISESEAELLSGFILTYVAGRKSGFVEANDPAAVFGPAMPPAPPPMTNITQAGIPQPIPAMPAAAAGIVSVQGPHIIIPAAPVAPIPPAPAPAPPGAVQLDSKGFPWDARIHASTKSTNKDGSWKGKRGADAATIANVEAELRRLMAIPVPQPAHIATQPAPGPVLVPSPAPAPAPAPPAAAPLVVTAEMQTAYVQFIGFASSAINTGKMTEAELNSCLNAVGIATLAGLGQRPDLLPAVSQLINGILAGRSA